MRKKEFKGTVVKTLLIFLAVLSSFAQTSIGKLSSVSIMPLTEVKEGMRGKAKTVFRGIEPEEFEVEILGVLPGAIGPKQDLIIGRLSGAKVEKTSVFAGMSGSPVFVDGKLIGAIAYSFPFSKEPICGITPVEQMIEIFGDGVKQKTFQKRAFLLSELYSTNLSFDFLQLLPRKMSSIQPIATPLAFGGFSSRAIEFFSSKFSELGFLPITSVGSGDNVFSVKKYDEKTLQAGASVGMSLIRGDYSITAFGTVTFRDGERIYAFGHPFLNLGNTSFPMSEARVIAIVPSTYNSFKLAVSDATVGAMTEDRNTGVLGQLGKIPKMMPVRLDLNTSRQKSESLHFEIVEDTFLTPILLNIAIYNAIVSNEKSLGDSTIQIDATIRLVNGQNVRLNRRFSGFSAPQLAAGAVAVPASILLQSGFENAKVSRIDLRIDFYEEAKSAVLEKVVVDRMEIPKGEVLEVQAFIRTNDEKLIIRKLKIKVPESASGKILQLVVADADSIQKVLPDVLFTPENLSDLVKKLNRIRKNNTLYTLITQPGNGVIVGSSHLPNLPPSFLATLNSGQVSGNFTAVPLSVLEEMEFEETDYVITGQKVLSIFVRDY